jgi:DNA repair protein RadA/Sms
MGQWSGQCSDCGTWNSLIEKVVQAKAHPLREYQGYAGSTTAVIQDFAQIALHSEHRTPTQIAELDRVLGGGLVKGSVILIGGDPGIGKSTLLLQAASILSAHQSVLYVTGEESLQQVVLRGHRLNMGETRLKLLAEIQLNNIIHQADLLKPQVMIIDSIQTMCAPEIQSAPGSVSQVRESAAALVQYAKQTGTAIFIVGHVTKEGALAGPRILEHMVDTVLYFEGEADSRYRALRAVKNRFGAVNELGIFLMTEKGLKEVSNPSAIFLQRHTVSTPGSVVTATWEGTRPMLVEVQALVDESHLGNPRRISVGIEHARLIMGLAVLHRHAGVMTYNQDVFINVVGGVKINETAADLAITCAVVSSLKNRPIPQEMIIFGEIGLGGELRPVQSAQARLSEAAKHGFQRAIVPKANVPKGRFSDLEIQAIDQLSDVIALI